MDLDHLKKLVDEANEEAERLNDTGPAYEVLVTYLDKERGAALVKHCRALSKARDQACDTISYLLATLEGVGAFNSEAIARHRAELATLKAAG